MLNQTPLFSPSNFSLLINLFFRADFQRMASQKDENGLTPFQLACSKLHDYLSKPITTSDTDKTASIPPSLVRFILFLHKDCKSNPNEPAFKKPKSTTTTISDEDSNDIDMMSQEDSQSSSSSSCEEDRKTSNVKFIPVFKLISNRCLNLIESLVKQSKEAEPINFNVYNSEGLSPLLQAIVKNEYKFCEKLLDMGLFNNPSDLRAQICRNSSVYLKETALQLLIRNSQTDLILKFVRIMSSSVKELAKLLEHQNTHGHNFLHTLSFSSNPSQFNTNYLLMLFKELTLAGTDVLASLLKTRDLLGRNPVHFCLLTSGLNRTNKDLELFFIEDIYTIVENAKIDEIFTDRDSFDRLPIHYLFYNTFNRDKDLAMYKKAEDISTIKSVDLPVDPKLVSSIDPVELLSLVIRQTKKGAESIDQKDRFGYTSMHYAAIRGASVCLSVFLSNSCDFLSRTGDSNTPLSSAIYFGNIACVQTLLRAIEEKSDLVATLNDFYYLPDQSKLAETKDELKWTGQLAEPDIYTRRKIQLYELILSYDWEGLSWLVLENLPKFSLSRLDSIRWAISAEKYSLALRLIDKLKREFAKNPLEAYETLFKASKDDSNRTILHLIANSKMSDKSSLIHILESLFVSQTVNKQDHLGQIKHDTIIKDFLEARDDYGATALHYAFYKQNFTLIDFVFSFLEKTQTSAILPNFEHLMSGCKDSNGQSAYSLVYWQIGRIIYSNGK